MTRGRHALVDMVDGFGLAHSLEHALSPVDRDALPKFYRYFDDTLMKRLIIY